jgi:hypothetical protein
MINVPISVGELLDKLSILEIKQMKIIESTPEKKEKLNFIRKEYDLLKDLSKPYLDDNNVQNLYQLLYQTNLDLWEIEDQLRVMEKHKDFSFKFTDLARSVYKTNDIRFMYKNEINSILDSELREVKEYVKY